MANKKGVNTSKTSMETGYNGFLSIFIISRGREIIQSSKNSKYLYKRNVIQFDGMGNLELKDRRANETLIQYLKQIDEEGIIANAPIVWTDKTSNTKHSCSLIPVEVSSLSALPVEERRNSKLPFACLVFEELGLNVQLCKAELQENFGLTNAEIELAEGLFTGKDICQIAEEKGITKNTIRERLKKVFMKTGTNRQAALVRMLRLFAK
ncbi:MAG: LuxR C-terminal-related transcriptional regulator [Pseudomonadota bacterium]